MDVPQSWILHFRFPPSLVVQYRYMSHWYGWSRKHKYSRWNRVASYSLRGEIYTFHGCRPPSWILHFRFPSSLAVRYRYMSHWYVRPRKHRYICWNRVAIKCGNGNNCFAVSTSGLRPPSWIFHSFKKVFRRTWLSLRSLNQIKCRMAGMKHMFCKA